MITDQYTDQVIYSHKQTGTIQIYVCILVILIMVIATIFSPELIIGFVLLCCIMAITLLLFSTLTINVSNNAISFMFGPVHLIKKEFLISDISGYHAVRNPWYYGWGIRWTPKGRLYNISGFDAILLRLNSGKSIMIGTNESEKLLTALHEVSRISPDVE